MSWERQTQEQNYYSTTKTKKSVSQCYKKPFYYESVFRSTSMKMLVDMQCIFIRTLYFSQRFLNSFFLTTFFEEDILYWLHRISPRHHCSLSLANRKWRTKQRWSKLTDPSIYPLHWLAVWVVLFPYHSWRGIKLWVTSHI